MYEWDYSLIDGRICGRHCQENFTGENGRYFRKCTRGGNTDIFLDIALEEARAIGGSAAKITLRDKVIAQCDGCMGCVQTGECIIQDDMQEVFQQLREADGIIWATPV